MIASTTTVNTETAASEERRSSTVDSYRTLLESDFANPIVETMAHLVPASRWCFARSGPAGNAMVLLSSSGVERDIAGLASSELQRQRAAAGGGPRISATPAFDRRYECGITLMFADATAQFGIFTLLRTSELGPFTSTEIRVLNLALDAACARFSALRLQPPHTSAVRCDVRYRSLTNQPPTGEVFVLDQNLEIVFERSSDEKRSGRLPPALEAVLRELDPGRRDGFENEAVVGGPLPLLIMRTRPMFGPDGPFIGVYIAHLEPPNSLTGVAERFHISPREMQVLSLLLDGTPLVKVATKLHITSSTVQDHITKMLCKTRTRNRSQLLANVLGWRTTPVDRNP